MTKTIELQYFFDPFCGWCYASAPALEGLAVRFPGQLRMMPSGLFFGGRPVSSMADHAWRNDQRIQSLTGQQYTERYHRDVLLAPDGEFTSAPATLALQALGERDAKLEPAFLHAVQIARYIDGRDTAREEDVAKVAVAVAGENGIDLTAEDFAEKLRNDAELRRRTLDRIEASQGRMNELGIRGVPQLVAMIDGKPTALDGEILYNGPDRLIAAIEDLTVTA
ncbi:DsbA family protein [Sphingobium sp. SJ10-10]|uniref:DsbA family protein n=1 Tax=Sphingobium sp. SJ10-10 TaxID=3114999 RepID=UPI002E199DB8|nr:DsbA family protein [Sphingobium sp. SJ10-10]